MSRLAVANGTIVAPDGEVDGHVLIEGGRIVEASPGQPPRDVKVVDARGGWICAGFIDLQINGGHGIDVTTEPGRIDELGRYLPQYGVTSFVPTVITSTPERRARALVAWANRRRDGHRSNAREDSPRGVVAAVPLGLHMEGPMLSPVRKGAHPERLLLSPTPRLVEEWSATSGVALVTLAPELDGAIDVVAALAARGVVVSIGHTDCSAGQFDAAIAAGATYVTHLFNAMRPFSHRDPGPVGASLAADRVIVGLICDGVHVDPVAVRMAWRAVGPERLNLVTDAAATLGMAPGAATSLGSVDITVGADGVRDAAGVLAGSNLSLDQAVRNLVAFTGCSLPDAVATVTSTPARLLRLADRGRVVPGARADVAVLDGELNVRATVVEGEVAWRS